MLILSSTMDSSYMYIVFILMKMLWGFYPDGFSRLVVRNANHMRNTKFIGISADLLQCM